MKPKEYLMTLTQIGKSRAMDKEYLTIKEYAEIKGVSVQSVYKRLNGSLKPFLSTVEGRKVLNRKALGENFKPFKPLNSFNVESEGLKGLKKDSSPCTDKDGASSYTHAEIERINRRNEEIIDELRQQIKEKDSQLKEMSDKIISLFETNQRLLENNQSLQLNYQMLLGATTETTNEVVNADETEEGAPVETDIINQSEETQTKKGFWQRLFNI